MGRLELDFGGKCEFGVLSPLASTCVEHRVTTFLITWSSGIDIFFFTSAIQCRKMWNGIKHLIENLPL